MAIEGHSIMQIRTANAEDAAAITAIYAPVVRDTAISFELQAPGPKEMARRIQTLLPTLPWLVGVDDNGHICGYVYASKFRERLAYQWAVEVTAYVREDCRGQGVGRRLYTRLFDILAGLGYYQAIAGITLPNAASVGLHEAMGFEPVTAYRNVGFKLGAWRDVGYWQKALRELTPPQAAPQPYQGGQN